MAGEPNTPLEGGTDNADLSDINNPANLNFADSDDAQNTPEEEEQVEQIAGTDEGDEEHPETASEDAQESEQSDTDEEQDAEGERPEVSDTATVKLRDGQAVTVDELKKGYLRQSDFTRKSQELSNKRTEVEQLAARLTTTVNGIADFLAKQIPDAPDLNLSMTDPSRYVREMAIHEAAKQRVAELIEQASAPKEVAQTLTDEQKRDRLMNEDAKLREAFPHLSEPAKREKFFADAARVAMDLGYSEAEIRNADDHRLFKMAYYARLGMEAEKAKAKVAQKVEKAPPVVPQKRAQQPNAGRIAAQRDAMKRLSKTGSIHDALMVDFD